MFDARWLRRLQPKRLFGVGILLVGLGLALTGTSVHLEAAAPNCGGCSPFHPLFVVTPVGMGFALSIVGGWLLGRA